MRRAVWLARYTGQRQGDVLRMSKADIEDGGIKVTQQKTGKKLWVPLHGDLVAAMRSGEIGPPWLFVQPPKGGSYTPTTFRNAWAYLMGSTPAGGIRAEGYTFHGLRASSVVALREVGCGDRDIESITGMSPQMVTRYSRFADQRSLAKAAIHRLERNKK
jgi:integrase